jgi:hypothetical protein
MKSPKEGVWDAVGGFMLPRPPKGTESRLLKEQLGIADDVDEENVRDFQSQLRLLSVRHGIYWLGPISSFPARSCWKPGSLRIGSQTGSILSWWREIQLPAGIESNRWSVLTASSGSPARA